jgi:hypothetical protein
VGLFALTVTLFPRDAGSPRRIEAFVATGASYSVVRRPVLDAPAHQDAGRDASRRAARRMATDPGRLEELSLGVDPLPRRLVPVVALV